MTTNYQIKFPDETAPAFGDITSQILDTPLSLIQLQNLRDTIEQKLKEERDEYYLFMVGDRAREYARQQFGVLCQALEMNSIGVIRLRPVRDIGEDGILAWTITQRSKLASAMLVLRASDDTWEVRPIPLTERKRSTMTQKEVQDTAALNALSLTAILFSQGIDPDRLGGFKLAS